MNIYPFLLYSNSLPQLTSLPSSSILSELSCYLSPKLLLPHRLHFFYSQLLVPHFLLDPGLRPQTSVWLYPLSWGPIKRLEIPPGGKESQPWILFQNAWLLNCYIFTRIPQNHLKLTLSCSSPILQTCSTSSFQFSCIIDWYYHSTCYLARNGIILDVPSLFRIPHLILQ